MKENSKKSGFTLIEIIVVLIILGVLAAIALPNLFGNIARSKGAEALAALNGAKALVVSCINANPTTANTKCDSATLPITGSPNFTYAVSGLGANSTLFTITATGRGTLTNSDTISISGDATTGAFSCGTSTAFKGIC